MLRDRRAEEPGGVTAARLRVRTASCAPTSAWGRTSGIAGRTSRSPRASCGGLLASPCCARRASTTPRRWGRPSPATSTRCWSSRRRSRRRGCWPSLQDVEGSRTAASEAALGAADPRPRPPPLRATPSSGRPSLTVPHPGLTSRRWVLAPLAELCPGRIVPGVGTPVRELLRKAPEHEMSTVGLYPA